MDKRLFPLIAGGVFTFLLICGIALYVSTRLGTGTDQNQPISPPVSTLCGIENCHGLTVNCGPNIAQMCTEEYALGDRCRQYAACEVSNGKCQLVESDIFRKCKSCILNCESRYAEDPEGAFECGSECV